MEWQKEGTVIQGSQKGHGNDGWDGVHGRSQIPQRCENASVPFRLIRRLYDPSRQHIDACELPQRGRDDRLRAGPDEKEHRLADAPLGRVSAHEARPFAGGE